MTEGKASGAAGERRALLWFEFAALYIAAPVGMAVLLPASMMFPVLFLVTAVGIVLLHATDGFSWRALTRGWSDIDWRLAAGFTALTAVVAYAVVMLTAPEALLALPLGRPVMFALVVALYPLLSALPQELVFRPLFFRRYGALLPNGNGALLLNAAVFSLAHLMYWSAIVTVMTLAGGLIFAWAYERRGSFAMAVTLHTLAGWIIFAAGLGVFFYSGNVTRPF